MGGIPGALAKTGPFLCRVADLVGVSMPRIEWRRRARELSAPRSCRPGDLPPVGAVKDTRARRERRRRSQVVSSMGAVARVSSSWGMTSPIGPFPHACRCPDSIFLSATTCPARPHGGGGAGGEVLSRSRGGFTTKLHLSADGRCRPLSLIVTAGQRVGRTRFKPVLEKICEPGPGHGPGRAGPAPPRKKPVGIAADKACGNGPPPLATTSAATSDSAPRQQQPSPSGSGPDQGQCSVTGYMWA